MALVRSDAGHGGKDPGSSYKGVREKDLTLDIDKRLSIDAKRNGITVDRTRTGDTTHEPTPRANSVKNGKTKYCISHHINAFKPNTGTGAEVLVSKYSDQVLAKEILKQLNKVGVDVKRGVKTRKLANGKDFYYMHRNTGNVNTVIVEYGFIDNDKDLKFLSDANNRQSIAEAVVRAICVVEGIKYKEKALEGSKPIVRPQNKPVSKELMRVQVGAYSDEKNAKEMLKKLKEKGFEGFIK